MRGVLIAGLLMVVGWPGPLVRAMAAVNPLPSAHALVALADPGATTTMTDANVAQLLAQAGAVGILAVVLFFYRRDFMRQHDAETQRTTEVVDVLKASTDAITASAVATARQTDATHRLARAVENIERRQAGLPPTARSSDV